MCSTDQRERLARDVADALAYAHERGIVHQDIKPANILLSNGRAIVADFGVAQAITDAGGASLGQTGLAVGTPAYMSPEQVAGSPALDGRSDVYSLGCVLFEMVVGIPPTGETGQTPTGTPVLDRAPAAMRSPLLKALATRPADRFATASEFANCLA